MKKTISLLLTLCMVFSLFAAMSASASAESAKECDLKSVFNSDLYVKADKAAGLEGNVKVSLDLLGCSGTLYLPGKADTEQLFFCWDDESITVSCNGIEYESGTAPVAAVNESVTYKITKGHAFAYVTVKTLKGSADVSGMFLELDESMGTIKAMNSDETHETSCFGSVNFNGDVYPYISMKGRGNSTWGFDKKPYNITFYKKADFDKKKSVELIKGVEAKKWSLLANYLDNSLVRNKIAMDLAQKLGIGLDTMFVDVWMNGEYLGNYLMTPKNDYNAPDGGYFLENDNYIDSEDPNFKLPGMYEVGAVPGDGYWNRITIKGIGDDAADAGVDAAAVEAWMSEAWNTVLDYDSEEYQNYFDLDSWAKMFLMYEVSKTYDCLAGSLLMHRDGLTENDKLIAGPTWDYDNSFGRTLHKFLVGMTIPNQMTAEGWYVDSIGLVSVDKPVNMLQELAKHDSFMQRAAEIYNEYKWAFEEIVSDVDCQQTVIEDSALMNNDLWGTNHIGSYYVVVPAHMGSGNYAVNYEVTLNWNSYLNNLREFASKRVLWLTDHLYAETPEGTITQVLNEKDCSVELKAVLSSGKQANTYQWQSSADGRHWTDIDGATKAKLKLAADEELNGIQYRCIVKNEGVNIFTTHGGNVRASAQTVLAPVEVNVTVGVDVSEVPLQSGELSLVMNGEEAGEFVFAASGNGWSICNKDGKYLAVDGKKLVLSDNPFVWSFENGVFSAATKVSYTHLGKWLGVNHTEKAYLTLSGDKLAVSMDGGAQAGFLLRTEYLIDLTA